MQISNRFEPFSTPKRPASDAIAPPTLIFQSIAEQPKDQITFSGRKKKAEQDLPAQGEANSLGENALQIALFNQPILADLLSEQPEMGEELDFLALQFLKMGAPPDMKGGTWSAPPLSLATMYGKPAVMKALIRAGADPNVKVDNGKQSALHVAVLNEDEGAFNFLLKNGANPEAKDEDGNTPLRDAVNLGQLGFVKKMLDLDANPDGKNNIGDSHLSVAAMLNHHEIAQLILEKGGNPDIQDANGCSPLAVAVGDNDFKMARLLLKHGANPFLPNNDGVTPLQLAENQETPDMRRLLNRFMPPNNENA
jgi:ankyrin repeat protein